MAKTAKKENFEQVMQQLSRRNYDMVYTLCGDEPYYTDKICEKIENEVLTEAEQGFNQTILYAKDIDTLDIVTNCKRYPMMSERQVVIVKEAQYLKNLDKLNSYLENPLSSTVLVLLFRGNGQLKRTNTFKLLSEYTVFESERVADYKLVDWIEKYLKEKGYKTDITGLQLIAESCGNNLSTIENELAKILINIGDRKNISVSDIEKFIGISKEYSVFELQNAISKGDIRKMSKIIHYFASDPKGNSIIMVVSSLSTFFAKALMIGPHQQKTDAELGGLIGINPYFMKDYRSLLKHYPAQKINHVLNTLNLLDLKSKGILSNTGDENLYKELLIGLT
ncbi:MAG: DNA polymerase III subunit delta [Flavobacteriales bacterium]|nr:DNA polymerase III subunit delta [Flavobacteriales bacterium]